MCAVLCTVYAITVCIIFILQCYFTVAMLLTVCVSRNYKIHMHATCILMEVYLLKYVLLRTVITHARA